MVQSNSLLIGPAVYGTVDVDIAGNQAEVDCPGSVDTSIQMSGVKPDGYLKVCVPRVVVGPISQIPRSQNAGMT